jgi:diguanylate cyclase (GGDEF)-like protein
MSPRGPGGEETPAISTSRSDFIAEETAITERPLTPEASTDASPTPAPLDQERRAYLIIIGGPQAGQMYRIEPHQELMVGRTYTKGVDVGLLDDGVSRRHARIWRRDDRVWIQDLGSRNGTFVTGERTTERELVSGDKIQLGAVTVLRFSFASLLEETYERRMLEAALRDPLTGLYNRRHFEERLHAEVSAARRHGRPLTMMVIDIDHFKQVNDRYGHVAGDEVLKLVARALEHSIRTEDIVARYGGEEFVLLARETTMVGARNVAERLRRLIEAAHCTWEERSKSTQIHIGVTVSVGVAQLDAEDDARAFFDVADHALYLAKQQGRNRVVAAGETGEAGEE